MSRTKDMTSGNPVKLILVFALPILAGNMLQQLYSLIDSLIIGRLLGVTALTAVSASGKKISAITYEASNGKICTFNGTVWTVS